MTRPYKQRAMQPCFLCAGPRQESLFAKEGRARHRPVCRSCKELRSATNATPKHLRRLLLPHGA